MYTTIRKYDCNNCSNKTRLMSGREVCNPMYCGMECVDSIKKSKTEIHIICYEYKPIVKDNYVKN